MSMTKRCERCGITQDRAQIFDAITDFELMRICERCAIIENIPLIKKPDTQQLKQFEKNISVNQRLRNLQGMREQPQKKSQTFFREDKLKELDKNPAKQLAERDKLNLIDNFHWELMKIRRRKGYSHKQLAEILGESALVLEMIEKGRLPDNSENIIRKLEQFFQIRLRKISAMERMIAQSEKKPVIINEQGINLQDIPEDTFEIEDEANTAPKKSLFQKMFPFFNSGNKSNTASETPATTSMQNNSQVPVSAPQKSPPPNPFLSIEEDIDIKKIRAIQAPITVGDLKAVHKKKIEVTRQEKIDEARSIEERKKIMQAQREQERLRIQERKDREEEARKKLDEHRQKMIEEKRKELQARREKELNDIDNRLGGLELLDKKDQE